MPRPASRSSDIAHTATRCAPAGQVTAFNALCSSPAPVEKQLKASDREPEYQAQSGASAHVNQDAGIAADGASKEHDNRTVLEISALGHHDRCSPFAGCFQDGSSVFIDANPEQSVPAGVSPPGMYGVPDTCEISDSNAARPNMEITLTTSVALIQSQWQASLLITFSLLTWMKASLQQRNNQIETVLKRQKGRLAEHFIPRDAAMLCTTDILGK
jgi:hypothetical protein